MTDTSVVTFTDCPTVTALHLTAVCYQNSVSVIYLNMNLDARETEGNVLSVQLSLLWNIDARGISILLHVLSATLWKDKVTSVCHDLQYRWQ